MSDRKVRWLTDSNAKVGTSVDFPHPQRQDGAYLNYDCKNRVVEVTHSDLKRGGIRIYILLCKICGYEVKIKE